MTTDEIPGFPGLRGDLPRYVLGDLEVSHLDDIRLCMFCEWYCAERGSDWLGVCQRFPAWIHVPGDRHHCGEFLAEPCILHTLIDQEGKS